MEWSMGDGLTEQNLKPERARWTEEMQSHPETQLEAPSFLLPFILLLSLCLENLSDFSNKTLDTSACVHAKSLQLCPTLCDPKDCHLPGSSIPGILQARILEWATISFSGGIFPTQGSNSGLLSLLHCR